MTLHIQVEVHIYVEQLCSYCVSPKCPTHLTFSGMSELTPLWWPWDSLHCNRTCSEGCQNQSSPHITGTCGSF